MNGGFDLEICIEVLSFQIVSLSYCIDRIQIDDHFDVGVWFRRCSGSGSMRREASPSGSMRVSDGDLVLIAGRAKRMKTDE